MLNFLRFFCLNLFIIFILALSSNSAYAEKSIRVGFFDYVGFNEKSAEGIYSGYGYDYLQEIAKYTGWKYEFVQCSWSQCLDMLAAGELDILGLVLKTKEREAQFDFTSIDMGVSYVILSVKNTNERLAFNESENVDGLTVGLFRGNVQNKLLREYCEKNNIKIIEKLYDTQNEINEAFANGDIDAIVSSNLRKVDNERVIGTFSPGPIYFVTTKGNSEIVRKVDYALSNIKSNNPNFDIELFGKHYPRKKNSLLLLTRKELDYIQSADKINVVYYQDFMPLEYLNRETDKFSGTVADIFDKISVKTGLVFNYIPVKSRQEALEYLISSKAEIIAAIPDYYISNNEFVLSLPYLKLQILSIKRKGFENVRNPKIAKTDDQGFFNLENFETFSNNIHCSSPKECIEMVNDGEADITFFNSYVAEYWLQNPKYRNIALLSLTDYEYQFSVGISQKSDILLLPIINKAINSITDSEYSEIIFNNKMHENYKTTILSFLYSNPIETVCVIFAFFTMLLVLLFFRNSMIQAKLANESKSMFLAKMSHEIRTPINAIIGFLRLLKAEKLNNTSSEYVGIIEKSAKTLLELVNSILDVSKIESGKIKLELKPFNIENEISSVASLFVGSMLESNIQLVTYLDPKIPSTVIGDQLKLRQILSNLLSNASKFTKSKGSVFLEVLVINKKNKFVTLSFSVRDTGIGIPENEIAHIISPFHQIEDGTISKQRGTGLGLTISNEFAKLMGSKIAIESQLGVGSTFFFTIKLEIVEDCEPMKPIKANIAYISIPYGQNDFEKSFYHLKSCCKRFFSFEEIFNTDLKKFDLILISAALEHDSILEEVKKLHEKNKNMQVAFLTYPIDSGYFTSLIDLNVAIIVRPLSSRSLHVKINELVSGKADSDDEAVESSEKKFFQGKVLVAEDEAINSKLIKIVLSRYGLDVTLVQNGQEAFDKYSEGFDIIFMDINMPIMDGKEATTAIRHDETCKKVSHIPIIALTANVMKGDEVEYLELGMNNVLSKPYETSDLEKILTKYLKKSN